MAAGGTEREVAVEFSDVTDKELIKRCAKLCQTYGVSAMDLAIKWEVMQMNSSKASQPMTFERLAEFETTLKNAGPKRQKAGASGTPGPSGTDARTQAVGRPRAPGTFNKDSAHLLHSVLGACLPKRAPGTRGRFTSLAISPQSPPAASLPQAIPPSSAARGPTATLSRAL